MSAFHSLGLAYAVEFNPFIPAGRVFVVAPGVVGRSALLLCRHWSEYALLMARATWHPEGERCPTWTDATECRCMLGGEA